MKEHNPTGKRFAPRKNIIFPTILLVLYSSSLLVVQAFREHTTLDIPDMIAIGVWLLVLGYYIWQWTGTYYEIRNGELFYRSGFTKGSIPVSSIRKIETHTRSWANTNAALTYKGMMITYNKWDELYIGPKDEKGFLQALLQINPDIKLKELEQSVTH